MINKLLVTLFFLAAYHHSFAQLNNTVFQDSIPVSNSDSGRLHLRIDNLSYFKNNEYFNNIVDGKTLFGYQLSPILTYTASRNIGLVLGAYLRKDFGNEKFSEIAPIFSVNYKKNRFGFIFGTLQGSVNHNLLDPLYDFERVIENRIENGIQMLWKGKNTNLDLWVDWEKMIYKASPFQERIAGGLNSTFMILNSGKVKIRIPVQLTVYHRGGQIDTVDLPIYTFTNTAVGAEVSKINKRCILQTVTLSAFYLTHKDFSPILQSKFKTGSGTLINASFYFKFFELLLSYWQGNQYLSSRGGLIYQSQSYRLKTPDFTKNTRNLIFIRIFKDFKLTDKFYITTRLEPYFDLVESKLEYSYGFYINYNLNFPFKP